MKDAKAALAWARRAAAANVVDGHFTVGMMHELGEGGLAAGGAEAPRLYRIAADAGHPGARYRLGVCYSKGRGVAQDRAEAARHWRLAADAGWPPAQADMSNSLVHGVGVAVDYREAMRYAKLADASGHPHGALQLGMLHQNGGGVPPNHREAVKWLAKAAAMGEEQSMRLLQGWAIAGDADAQAALGRL